MKRFFTGVKRFFRRDVWRKIIAVFFAMLIYFTIRERISNDELVFEHIPVQIEYPEDLTNISDAPVSVRVVLGGSSRTLRSLSPLDVICRVRVKKSRYVDGQPYELQLSDGDFKIRRSFVDVKSFSPDKLTLMLEPVIAREATVKLNFDKTGFSPNYGFTGRVVSGTVRVRGPRSIVDKLSEVESAPIPLAGATAPFKYEPALRGPEGVAVIPSKAIVQVEVAIRSATRAMENLPVLMQIPAGSGFEYESAPATAKVELKGPAGSLNKLTAGDVQVFMNMEKYPKEGEYSVPLQVRCSDPAVEAIRTVPETLKVKVNER